MKQQEKKIFCPKIYNANLDLSKRWFVYWYVPDKKEPVRIYGGINRINSIDLRLEKANEIIAALDFKKPKETTFFERLFEIECLNWRKKTISAYSTVVKYFLQFLRNKNPDHATKSDIENFFIVLHKKGTSKNTIEKYRATLYTLYDKAISHDLTNVNPVKKVKKNKRNPVSLMYFSKEQRDRLIPEIKKEPQLYLCTQLLYYCFIRPGEQRYLKISDINFEHG